MPYRETHGARLPEPPFAAACSRWNRPPLGGLGRAASAACFRRSTRWSGVSSGSSDMAERSGHERAGARQKAAANLFSRAMWGEPVRQSF